MAPISLERKELSRLERAYSCGPTKKEIVHMDRREYFKYTVQ